jgi:hypothetical protein
MQTIADTISDPIVYIALNIPTTILIKTLDICNKINKPKEEELKWENQ